MQVVNVEAERWGAGKSHKQTTFCLEEILPEANNFFKIENVASFMSFLDWN